MMRFFKYNTSDRNEELAMLQQISNWTKQK